MWRRKNIFFNCIPGTVNGICFIAKSQFCDTNVTKARKWILAVEFVMYLDKSYNFVIEISFFMSAMSQFHHEIVTDAYKEISPTWIICNVSCIKVIILWQKCHLSLSIQCHNFIMKLWKLLKKLHVKNTHNSRYHCHKIIILWWKCDTVFLKIGIPHWI